MAVYGRTKPYANTKSYCDRCGIDRSTTTVKPRGNYCMDCQPAARQLGWTE